MSKHTPRQDSGLSLVELLVVTVIMLLVSVAIFGMLTANAKISRRLENKVSAIESIRKVAEFIGRDVRMARSFGDIYGNMVTSGTMQGKLTSQTAGGAAGNALQFPDPATDPLYGSAGAPAGWTGPWPIALSRTTLIVQVPTFDANGFPTAIPVGLGSPPVGTVQDNMETHVYRVVPDPDTANHPNEFIMELWKFPGANPANLAANPASINCPPVSGPIILTKGIVGPMRTNNLNIFEFVDSTNPNAGPVDASTINSTNMAAYTGVVLNMEVRNFNASATVVANQGERATIPFKTEVYMRNQIMSTTAANPN